MIEPKIERLFDRGFSRDEIMEILGCESTIVELVLTVLPDREKVTDPDTSVIVRDCEDIAEYAKAKGIPTAMINRAYDPFDDDKNRLMVHTLFHHAEFSRMEIRKVLGLNIPTINRYLTEDILMRAGESWCEDKTNAKAVHCALREGWTLEDISKITRVNVYNLMFCIVRHYTHDEFMKRLKSLFSEVYFNARTAGTRLPT